MVDCDFLRSAIIGELHDYRNQRQMPVLRRARDPFGPGGEKLCWGNMRQLWARVHRGGCQEDSRQGREGVHRGCAAKGRTVEKLKPRHQRLPPRRPLLRTAKGKPSRRPPIRLNRPEYVRAEVGAGHAAPRSALMAAILSRPIASERAIAASTRSSSARVKTGGHWYIACGLTPIARARAEPVPNSLMASSFVMRRL